MTAPIRTLQGVFPGLHEEEARNLLERGEIHEYPAETVLCHEDAYEATFYIILRGKVLVTKQIGPEQVRTSQDTGGGRFLRRDGDHPQSAPGSDSHHHRADPSDRDQ